jgi:hypothetical protein
MARCARLDTALALLVSVFPLVALNSGRRRERQFVRLKRFFSRRRRHP